MSQIERHFGPCYSARNIGEDEVMPIGGRNMFNGLMDIGVVTDFAKFKPMFDAATKIFQNTDIPKLADMLKDYDIGMDATLYAAGFAFNKAFGDVYPQAHCKVHERMDHYRPDTPPQLSDVVEAGSAMCAEVALLAHHFFDKIGIDNKYVVGQLLKRRDHEFGDEHSFLVVGRNGNSVIYDPTHPIPCADGSNAPSLFNVDSQKLKEMFEAKGNHFLWVTNAASREEVGYGVSSGANIWPEQIVDASPRVLVARSAAPSPAQTVKASAS